MWRHIFEQKAFNNIFLFTILTLALSGLAACGSDGAVKGEAKYPTGADRGAEGQDIYSEPESVFGESGDGITLFGDKKKKRSAGNGLAINSYLWRASLNTVSFMPLSSADPFGGVIITEWYRPDDTPGERFKANVFILTRELRTDGVRVKLFRQEKKDGQWVDVPTSEKTQRRMEDIILTRARSLRVADLRSDQSD